MTPLSLSQLINCAFGLVGTGALAILSTAAAASAGADLPACAQQIGWLQTRHWLTIDLVRQVERSQFYNQSHSVDFNSLSNRVSRVGEELRQSRTVYNRLYKANTAEAIQQLNARLHQLSDSEDDLAIEAGRLLASAGSASNHSFAPLPVSDAELRPGWHPQLIDKHFKPKRILFGSTGRPGDDRTLPLGFDFGSGIFGPYVAMSDSNSLAISPGLSNRTDAVYQWMASNHSGHHYWAGVYNNQNTYVAPWFIKEQSDDSDLWMKLADGKVLKGAGDWRQVNIWNPHIPDYIERYCEAQARTFGSDPYLVCYDYTAEPHPFAAQPFGEAQYSGYNNSAVAAFRAWLQKRFGTIGKLNSAWETNYAAFDVIQPPPDKYLRLPPRATPLTYEFEVFRCESHAAVWKRAYEGYRKYDKAKPIVANAGMFMSGWPVEALDAWKLQQSGAADWIDMHMNNFWPNLPEQIYLYSLCRLSHKVPVQFEYVWTFPRTGAFDDSNEADFAAICQGSVWRNLVWGKKALVFFDFYYDWPAYHNAFFDRDVGYSILRPSACVVPVTKRKALRFNDILMNTEVARPPIIVIEPTAAMLNSPPLHPNKSFSYHTDIAGKQVHNLLFPKNYPFLYVPEQAIIDGYNLDQHKVIILPEAPYLPGIVSEKLLKWLRRGGTLIAFGPPGVWTPYGKPDLRILNAAFQRNEVIDEDPGKWKWKWSIHCTWDKFIKPITDKFGNVIAARTDCGKGQILVATSSFDSEPAKNLFYGTLEAAIGARPATCAQDSFELVMREDKRGHKYLFVLNPHTRDTREDEILFAKAVHRCTDLGVGSGVNVPISRTDSGASMRTRLNPGEGTVFDLQ